MSEVNSVNTINKKVTKKYAILSSIIIILAVILVLTMFLKNRGYSLPTLKAIDSGITEIKISRGTNETLSIKLEEGKWTVNDKYKADSDVVADMTNALNSIQPVEIISRGDAEEEDREKYRLFDDESLNVIAIDGSSKEVRNIRFGMKSNLGNNVYSQIDKDKNIYLLGNLSSNPKDIFDKSEDDIINKTISSARNDSINKIIISYNNRDYTLEKSEGATNWIKNNDSTININDLYGQVYTIANLKADGLIKEDSNKNSVLYKIEISTDSNTFFYEILNKNNRENNYEVTLENDNNRYYITDATFTNLKDAIDNIINK